MTVNSKALNLCTLFDKRFLLQGITMIQSVERFAAAKINWTVLALDEETFQFLTEKNLVNLEIVTLDSIDDKELKALKGIRPWNQLCWTSAACLLRFVNLKIHEGEIAGYIDADCFFFYDVLKTLQPLHFGSCIAIHEHRYSADRVKWLNLSGRFNVGLVAGVSGTEFDQCIERWRIQVLDNCEVDESAGKCGDQTYLNEWPDLYRNLSILDEKGVGVAPWNLNNYHITLKNNQIHVDLEPLQFFHFHGLEIGWISKSLQIYKYAPGYSLNWGEVSPIYEAYLNRLREQVGIDFSNVRNIKFSKIKWWISGLIKKNLVLNFQVVGYQFAASFARIRLSKIGE